jgi:hypothetical protein
MENCRSMHKEILMQLLIDNRCEENPSVIYRSWHKHTRTFNYGMFAGDKFSASDGF